MAPPLIVKKSQKTENTNNMIFVSIIKIHLDNFYNNFISSAGLSRNHYFRGAIHEIHDFRVFLRISQWVFDISSLIARSYRVLVINIKSLIMGDLVTLETRLKVPIFAVFWRLWTFFELFVLAWAKERFVQCMHFYA